MTSTRDRILNATTAVIEAGGAAKVRVHAIAAECGITATTINRYFGSRCGLVNAAQAERYRLANRGLDATYVERVQAMTSADEFRQFVEAVWRYFLTNPDFVVSLRTRAFLLGSTEGIDDLREEMFAAPWPEFDRIVEILTLAHQRGWTRPELDILGTATALVVLLEGRVRFEFEASRADIDALNRACVDMVLRLLFQ